MGNFGFQEMLLLSPIIIAIGCYIFRKPVSSNIYDTLGARVLAGILDGLLFLPLSIADAFIQDHATLSIIIPWSILYAFSRLVYTIWMHGKYGQTLGKMATGVLLLNVSETRIVNYREAILRESPYLIMIVFYVILDILYLINPDHQFNQTLSNLFAVLGYSQVLWFLLEIITTLTNSKRRALHDYLAKSVVIRKEAFTAYENKTPAEN